MPEKFYPLILGAINGSEVRMKIVNGPVEYDDFYSRYVKQGTEFREIKTLEALYKEKLAKMKQDQDSVNGSAAG